MLTGDFPHDFAAGIYLPGMRPFKMLNYYICFKIGNLKFENGIHNFTFAEQKLLILKV